MNGRKLGLIVVAVMAAAATFASGTAEAHGRARVGVGVYVGPGWGPGWGGWGPGWGYPAYGPYYYPGYYPPPAVVAVPTQPPQYIEQGADGNPIDAPADPGQMGAPYGGGAGGGYEGSAGGAAPVSGQNQNPNQFWYHCTRPEGYYPYVKTCPGGWEQVPAHPPAGS